MSQMPPDPPQPPQQPPYPPPPQGYGYPPGGYGYPPPGYGYPPPGQGWGSDPRATAASKVKGPAIGLIVVACLWMLYGLYEAAGTIRFANNHQKLVQLYRQAGVSGEIVRMVEQNAGTIIRMALGFWAVTLCLSALTIFGAIQMLLFKSRSLAYTAAIIQLIPCISGCFIIGIPFGIWALVVLSNAEVKAAFER